jgi:hypothetical protein
MGMVEIPALGGGLPQGTAHPPGYREPRSETLEAQDGLQCLGRQADMIVE